jgi:glycosyltransferase involved in cell wall biosynthesis
MKIAVVFPPMLVAGRPLDFTRIWEDPRGTTGSEIMTLAFAAELADRGHDVELLIENPNAPVLVLRKTATRFATVKNLIGASSQGYDAVLSALDINILRGVPKTTLRVCLQQLNDFAYCQQGFDEFCDLYVVPSDDLRRHLASIWPVDQTKWRVIPNGCYADVYDTKPKTPGLCVYTSSPDRGLHHVVSQWPIIKAAASHARLRIYYFSLEKWLSDWRGRSADGVHPVDEAHRINSQYVDRVLPVLQDVEVIGPKSRAEICDALSEAELLLYPTDCVAYNEGFSCSTLEGCAAGAIPILVGSDALGSIYRGACPVIDPPATQALSR